MNLEKMINKKWWMKAAAFLPGFLFLLILHKIYNVPYYPYDASVYWHSGEAFGFDKFSFGNFNISYRGYLYPFFCYLLRKSDFGAGGGIEQLCFEIVTSMLYSYLFAVLFPDVVGKMLDLEINIKIRCIFTVVCGCFFRGMILYPLTDLFALTFLMFAIYLFQKYMENVNKNCSGRIIQAIGIGMSLAAAYYARPVYLSAIAGFAVIMIWFVIRKRKISLLCIVLGIYIMAIPQIQINHVNFGSYSPFVLTSNDFEGSLYLAQLNWGVTTQKYETNCDTEVYENAAMNFRDVIGERLLGGGSLDSYSAYIKFCVKHFADMALIYLKHIFNGLDIVYPDLYIMDLNANRFIPQLFNYMLIFMGTEGILFFIKRKHLTEINLATGFCYLLPILLVIPTAVETRFFVGCHIALYLLAVMVILDREWWKGIKNMGIKKIFALIAFLCICFLLNNETFNSFQELGIPLW